MRVHTFPKGICLKVNVIARREFELAYCDSSLHCFNHYTTRTPPATSEIFCWLFSTWGDFLWMKFRTIPIRNLLSDLPVLGGHAPLNYTSQLPIRNWEVWLTVLVSHTINYVSVIERCNWEVYDHPPLVSHTKNYVSVIERCNWEVYDHPPLVSHTINYVSVIERCMTTHHW